MGSNPVASTEQELKGKEMKILVVRHGETEWNSNNLVLGRNDVDLNEIGIRQAQELRDNFPGQIHHVFSSPLKIAAMTASIVCEGRDLDIQYDNRLLEMDFGSYEGKDRCDLAYNKKKKEYFIKYPEGESYLMVAQRVYNFLDEVIEKYSNENVMLVTHNGICRVLNTYFNGVSNEEFSKYSVNNCEVTEYIV